MGLHQHGDEVAVLLRHALGFVAGLGVGVIIVGLMVLMGGGGSSGGGGGGGLSYQEKKDVRKSVEWGMSDALRKNR